jgi:hypothetical protein
MDPVRLYMAYAPKDELFCRQLEGHLRIATLHGQLTVWHRGKLLSGSETREECEQQRNAAEILLLLMSADLMTEAFDEVEAALERRAQGARVIPVLVRPTVLIGSLADLAMLPANGKAITLRDNRDGAWNDVVSGILRVAEALRRGTAASPEMAMVPLIASQGAESVPQQSIGTKPSGVTAMARMNQAMKNLILVLIAEPHTSPRTEPGPEVKAIRICVERAEHREHFCDAVELAVTPGSLVYLLTKYRPRILHFSGHGARGGKLVLENEQGEGVPVDPLLLSRLFRAHNEAQEEENKLRCVVLNACFSAEQAAAIALHVDCVLGTTGTVHNDTALAFAEGFYTALTAGHSVAVAAEMARVQANLKGMPSPDDLQLLIRPGIDAQRLCFV